MKKDELAQDYAKYEALQKAYDEAKAAGDDAGMKAAKGGYRSMTETINEKGKTYNFMYRLYEDMRKRGNDCIDISEPYEYEDAAGLASTLKDFGFDRFTFSSAWSGAAESAWLFQQSGCCLEGMVEITGKNRDFVSGAYEKAHAFLFRID